MAVPHLILLLAKGIRQFIADILSRFARYCTEPPEQSQ